MTRTKLGVVSVAPAILLSALTAAGCYKSPEEKVCGDGVCGPGETCNSCALDCGSCPSGCGDGICGGAETCNTCPADCGLCTDDASVTFRWTIHNVPGGESITWGASEANEVCELVNMLVESPLIAVQLWVETTGDDVADMSFDFECPAGSGLTTPEWNAGDSLTYAFALVDGMGTLLSQSASWGRTTLRGGVNNLGTVNFYIGDYGPLEVELQWADKVMDPAFGDCGFPPDSVSVMGYLLCWGAITAGSCPYGNLYDEIDIDVDPAACRNELVWDITDFGAYTLILDGEDVAGTSVWGMECRDLVVDSMEPYSNRFICQVLMTSSP